MWLFLSPVFISSLHASTNRVSQDVQIYTGITTSIRCHASAIQPPKFSNTFPKAQLDEYVPILFWLSTSSWTPASCFFWNNKDETMTGADLGCNGKHLLSALVVTVAHSSEPGRAARFEVRRGSVLSVRLLWEWEEWVFQFSIFFSWWEYLVKSPPRQFPTERLL